MTFNVKGYTWLY